MTVALPRLSVSEISTLHASFADDLAAYAAAGLDGIGIWELKLGDGPDDGALEAFAASGLASASAVPQVPSILPLPKLDGPTDPRERVDLLLRSLNRLAPFSPSGIVCLTGSGTGLDPDVARSSVVEGLRELGAEAARLGLRLAVEPYQEADAADWSIVTDIPDTLELIRDAGDAPSLALQFDAWHLWSTPTLERDIAEHVDRFAGVHVGDAREPTRGWADRVLAGEGIADVPRILRALDDAGYDGLYDIEIFSDDGTFGTAHDGSYWALAPDEFLARARASFAAAWEQALTPRHQAKEQR